MAGPQGDIALGGKEKPDDTAIREHLANILASVPFRGSRRCQDFLAYVVAKALEGDNESLKERTVAVRVYGRRADADLDHDSIVRVGAREVRKRLTEYYASEGADSPVRIELPTGSYHPAFHNRPHLAHESPAAPELIASPLALLEPEQPATLPPRKSGKRQLLAVCATLALLVATIAGWKLSHPALTAFDAFWQPAFQQKNPVLFVMAHPIVYYPSSRATKLNEEKNPSPGTPLQRAINLPPEDLNGADIIPVFDQFVGLGDAIAAVLLKELFVTHAHPTKVRMASKLDFADLRGSSAVLIGAYTNRWTMEFFRGLRYQFDYCGSKPCIKDTAGGRGWTLTGKSDNGRSPEDYIVLCRMPNARTGGFVVIAAGLTQYGTEEVGRILADPAALNPVLAKLPPTWRNQNLQLVLHLEIVGDAPGPPELIASHSW